MKVGLPTSFRFYDLRHTGNTLAAESGASLRDLMVRMGQSSVRAALIYQHSTLKRQREIADDMDARFRKRRKEGEEGNGRDEATGGAASAHRAGRSPAR